MLFKKKIINFKGIKFNNLTFDEINNKLHNKSNLLVAPAASALSQIDINKEYHQSLKEADIVILDSGFFCILLRIFKGLSVNRLSGYLFLKKFLSLNFKKKIKFFLVEPSKKDLIINKSYLNKKKINNITSYVAPKYNTEKFKDFKLLKKIRQKKPRFIIVNIGGGVQEKLGLYIKKNIKFKCSIICTGAAIAFLTKRQAPINNFIDRLYLGWLIRTLFDPTKFFMRNLSSLKLVKFFIFR